MRILKVASWYRSSVAPARGSYIREQAHALAARGHDVHVVYLDKDARTRPFRVRAIPDGGVIEHSIACPFPLHRLFGFYCPALLEPSLKRLVLELDPDVIHAHGVRPGGVLGARMVGVTGRPMALTEHSCPLEDFWKTRHGYRQIEAAYLTADALLAVSNSSQVIAERLFPSTLGKWQTIYNGIDTHVYRPAAMSPPSPPLRILFLGGMEKRKGLPLLLHAMKTLQMNFSLTVAGRNVSEPAVRKLAARFGQEGQVESVGMIARSDVPALMQAHHVLVLASERETFGLVVAEGLACGLPVVATRCGGPEEIVPSFGGEVVPVNDSDAIARSLGRILSNYQSYDRNRLHRHVHDHFSLHALVTRLETMYAGLLKGKTVN